MWSVSSGRMDGTLIGPSAGTMHLRSGAELEPEITAVLNKPFAVPPSPSVTPSRVRDRDALRLMALRKTEGEV